MPPKLHKSDNKIAFKAQIDVQMATKLESDMTQSKSGHFKVCIYLSVTEKKSKKSSKIVKMGNFREVPNFDPQKIGKNEFSGYSGYATSKEHNFMKRY